MVGINWAAILPELLWSYLASFFFGILFALRGKKLYVAAFGGLIGWLIYSVAAALLPSVIPAYFCATCGMTMYSEICARVLRSPASVFLAPALIPLVPGGGIYDTMIYCIRGRSVMASEAVVRTIGIAGALAMGVVMISTVMRLLPHNRR